MKKFSGTIAMILVLVMLASSFSGCTLVALMNGATGADILWGVIPDALLIAGIILFVVLVEAPDEAETGIFLVGAEDNHLTQVYSLRERINSLSEMGMDSVMARFYDLPETKRASLVSSVYSMPRTEITSSTERLNALSDAELVSVLCDIGALSDEDFDLMLDKLNERARFLPAAVAAVEVPRERAFMALSLAY